MPFLLNKCISLSSADLTGFYTSKITNMKNKINIIKNKNFDTNNVVDMNSMFSDNYYLK